MNSEITIIIADDHALVRKGLREVIEEVTGLRVIAETSNGRETLHVMEEYCPHIVILDVDMPLMNGFETAREIRRQNLDAEIIFLTMHRDEEIFREAVEIGAKGFVLKDGALDDILLCIHAVADGEHYTSPAVTSFLFNRARQIAESPTVKNLTPTERRVLKHVAENASTKEIAEQLFVSVRTIEKHRENICRKLNLKGNHALLKFALSRKSELL